MIDRASTARRISGSKPAIDSLTIKISILVTRGSTA